MVWNCEDIVDVIVDDIEDDYFIFVRFMFDGKVLFMMKKYDEALTSFGLK